MEHRFVHEDVRAAGESRHRIEWHGIAGEGDRSILKVEPIAERRVHGRMPQDGGRHANVVIVHHRTAARHLVRRDVD